VICQINSTRRGRCERERERKREKIVYQRSCQGLCLGPSGFLGFLGPWRSLQVFLGGWGRNFFGCLQNNSLQL